MTDTPPMRIDKWLWAARFFKTRSLASKAVAAGAIRLDGERMTKPHRLIKPGDVLTFMRGNRVAVIKITALSPRRGPASEAVLLYEDLSECE